MKYTLLKKETTKPFISIVLQSNEHERIKNYVEKFSIEVQKTFFIFENIIEPRFLETYGVYDSYVDESGQLKKWSEEELNSFLEDQQKDKVITKLFTLDDTTKNSIERGFEFDGHVFSLSKNAQSNWNRILSMYSIGILGSSIEISTKNDSVYVLSSKRIKEFAAAYHNAIENALRENRKNKQSI